MKESRKKILDESAKYAMDISKLIFGGVVLSVIMKNDLDPWLLYGFGISATILTFVAGVILYIISNK